MTAPALQVPQITPQQKREAAFEDMFAHARATALFYSRSKFSKEDAAAGSALLAYLDKHKADMKKAVVS